jgi:hypothetical protein
MNWNIKSRTKTSGLAKAFIIMIIRVNEFNTYIESRFVIEEYYIVLEKWFKLKKHIMIYFWNMDNNNEKSLDILSIYMNTKCKNEKFLVERSNISRLR